MVHQDPSRRDILVGAAGLAATVSLAGCGTSTASLDPKLPSTPLATGGWTHVDTVEEAANTEIDILGRPQQVSITAQAEVYENNGPVTELTQRYNVDVDASTIPAMGFIAAKARPNPPVTRLLGLSDGLMTHAVGLAEDRAIRALRDRGLENVRLIEEGSLAVAAGPTADHRLYRAAYPYDAFHGRYRGRQVTVAAGTLDVEVQLGVWPYRGLLTSGAGLYPAEAGDLTLTADGFSTTVSLGFEPEAYRKQLRELISLIS